MDGGDHVRRSAQRLPYANGSGSDEDKGAALILTASTRPQERVCCDAQVTLWKLLIIVFCEEDEIPIVLLPEESRLNHFR